MRFVVTTRRRWVLGEDFAAVTIFSEQPTEDHKYEELVVFGDHRRSEGLFAPRIKLWRGIRPNNR